MQKIKYFTFVYHTILLSCSKRCQIRFDSLFDYEINNGRELQNIAINHSADIDYNNFVKVYRECTKKPCSFLTIDTTLPASDPLTFRKKLFSSCKDDSNCSASNY